MTEPHGAISTPNVIRAFPALFLGSAAAPIAYIALGYMRPTGFVDFQSADFRLIATAFLGAWMLSAFLTVPIGAAFWGTLHARKIDGFFSYSAVALGAAIVTGVLFTDSIDATALVVALALVNGVLTRLLELLMGRQKP